LSKQQKAALLSAAETISGVADGDFALVRARPPVSFAFRSARLFTFVAAFDTTPFKLTKMFVLPVLPRAGCFFVDVGWWS
jgi:hypothetical protein